MEIIDYTIQDEAIRTIQNLVYIFGPINLILLIGVFFGAFKKNRRLSTVTGILFLISTLIFSGITMYIIYFAYVLDQAPF